MKIAHGSIFCAERIAARAPRRAAPQAIVFAASVAANPATIFVTTTTAMMTTPERSGARG